MGMDRDSRYSRSASYRCPHACGDGPHIAITGRIDTLLSPRVWGWTGRERLNTKEDGCCPHACGDGPEQLAEFELDDLLSPRVWGWTAMTDHITLPRAVVPTRVGMDR